jgi:peptide-methionine (S)-S-oxide reductase
MTTTATTPSSTVTETAVLGGGCFWCLEAVFDELDGVLAVESGYAGGATRDPTYEAVCSGRTGHAEVVRITFDPARLSFHDLLTVFFTIHDPTTLNRQGGDVGTQYRSAIFCQSQAQRATAEEVVAGLNAQRLWSRPIVTEIAGAEPFYEAERYHQDYFAHNAGQPYCMMVVAPKVAKFRKQFTQRLKRKAPA